MSYFCKLSIVTLLSVLLTTSVYAHPHTDIVGGDASESFNTGQQKQLKTAGLSIMTVAFITGLSILANGNIDSKSGANLNARTTTPFVSHNVHSGTTVNNGRGGGPS